MGSVNAVLQPHFRTFHVTAGAKAILVSKRLQLGIPLEQFSQSSSLLVEGYEDVLRKNCR
jgi:hypothetical protein